jgi:soluble lytic murein transglycosylase-like protein
MDRYARIKEEALNPSSENEGKGENLLPGAAMRLINISTYTMKRNILVLCVFPVASCIVLFITGFIFYTPPDIEPPYDSMTMRIERTPDTVFTVTEDKKRATEEEQDQSSIAAVRLPHLNERPEKVRMAKEYKALLAQMSSILEDMGSEQISYAEENGGAVLASIKETDSVYEEMSEGSPLEAIIRERMVTVKEVLEYASSQMGISVDLLAAVAWAESKMLPYALNVRGKAYYCTSREQALRMLGEIETGNVDIGLLQVNYRLWGEPLGLQKEDLLDSKVCAIIGAMILTYNLQRHRDPWVAIGRYHSGNVKRMRIYQTKVSRGLTIIRTLSTIAPQQEVTELSETSRKIRRDPVIHRIGLVDA